MQSKLIFSGFVLHRRPYRETSWLIDFFTFDCGRITAVAKGVRGNTKSNKKSLLQPFQCLEIEFFGRSKLKNLGRVDALGAAFSMQGNALYCAFYLNEILVRALPESEATALLYRQYEYSLVQLSALTDISLAECEPILRNFEFVLLQEMGYLPDFSCDAETNEPINSDYFYTFDPNMGFSQTHPEMRGSIKGKHLIDIYNMEYTLQIASPKDLMRVAKTISRLALVQIIGDRPIKAREFFL